MGRFESDRRFVTGHIGFDVATSAVWDEEEKDFVRVRPAQVAPYAVDLAQSLSA